MSIQKKFNQEEIVSVSPTGKFFWYLSYILVIPVFIGIKFRNDIIQFKTKINEADSGIDVQLAQRKDMLVKLIDSTKQAMKWEKETLSTITKLRKIDPSNLSTDKKIKLNDKMESLQHSINLQMEAYPDLKSIEAVQNLQNGIKEVENNLAAARRIYNSNVSIYNTKIQAYPINVVAESMNCKTKIFFEASEAQQEDVKVELNV